ncbi:MAG: aldo/keto reductase [Bryobacteraceae bacterium]
MPSDTLSNLPLGNTGIELSPIAVGTVELGIDYGFPGTDHYRRPAAEAAVALLHHAVDAGVTLIDTAPTYGNAETLVGQALSGMSRRPHVASKLIIEAGRGQGTRDAVAASVDRSLRALGIDCLDLLQVHNANLETLADADGLEALVRTVDEGKVRFLGASVYTVDEALAALELPQFRVIQVPYNMLDCQMARKVFALALERGVGVLVRSAFLRGVLTPQVASIPEKLGRLRDAALGALKAVGEPVERLAVLALRFAMSAPGVSSVIVGVRSIEELDENLAAVREGRLPAEVLERLAPFALDGEPLVSPPNWKGLT